MEKIKFPVLNKKIIKKDQILFEFDCGDMWKRKKVSRWDDIEECLKVINIQLKKKKKILKGNKIKKFSWIMNYTIPDKNNIKSLKKTNKYTVQKHNIHRLQPMEFYERNKTLFVNLDLIFTLNENIIILLANKLAGLKNICFMMGLLDLGFLEDEPDQQTYIHEKLKKKDWREHTLQIKERYGRMDDEDGILHDNDLDGLTNLKSEINPKIKFEFLSGDKEDKKILKKYSLI
jgi:hypothetical protein|tara:strand:+ start:1461 stop:2156 length:696 start_codon:yes stop_codon:yes gene_type:complete